VALHQGAPADWRFADLPEFQSGAFQGVASVPLLDAAAIVGMANFCRTEVETWRPRDLSFLLGLSLPLGALLTASSLREQLQKMERQLADRKLLERAKGLLQASFGWSEEEAYLQVRRLSRQRRTCMREIAREIIEASESRADASAQSGN
jgi:GAF domain-containing protein